MDVSVSVSSPMAVCYGRMESMLTFTIKQIPSPKGQTRSNVSFNRTTVDGRIFAHTTIGRVGKGRSSRRGDEQRLYAFS